jgi:cytochrome c553
MENMMNNRLPMMFGALAICAAAIGPASAQNALEAKLQPCFTCHGQDGKPINATTPIIFGQTTAFMVKQLHDFRSADRASDIMAAFSKTLQQEELRPAAVYFTNKTWPANPAAAAPGAEPEGIAICKACHQQDFKGGLPAPRLAGQSYQYMINQMNQFADGRRTNNMDMIKLMQELTPAQRDTIAKYLAAL